jgi:hypothetical protein
MTAMSITFFESSLQIIVAGIVHFDQVRFREHFQIVVRAWVVPEDFAICRQLLGFSELSLEATQGLGCLVPSAAA